MIRAQLRYIRDLTSGRCLSFIDKNCHVADAGTKSKGSKSRLLMILMMYNAFMFGFVFRLEVRKLMRDSEVDADRNNRRLRYVRSKWLINGDFLVCHGDYFIV